MFARKILSVVPEGRSFVLNRRFTTPRPDPGRAVVVLTVLTDAGPSANGKISAGAFLPSFCDTLRASGLETLFVSSERELARIVSRRRPLVLLHLYGEDHTRIASSRMDLLERDAVAVFNGSRTGELLADKLISHRAFEAGGVPVPALFAKKGFVRQRAGTGLETFMDLGSGGAVSGDDTRIRTEFVDTAVTFDGRRYYTTVRLLCVDDIVLHAYPRARDVQEGNGSVHSRNTPLDPALIEHLHQTLVATRAEDFSRVARRLFDVLGHGFYAHDLLIDQKDGSISVCESGFKFDDRTYTGHLKPISDKIPSQAVMFFPVCEFARLSARAFLTRCDAVLAGRN